MSDNRYIVCPNCNGTGKKVCPVCNGSLKDPRYENHTCTYCRGSGTITCKLCDGDGTVPEDHIK